jgi:2-keto-4-pentenoate hydratase
VTPASGDVHPRLAAALEAQLDHWRSTKRAGAAHVGWKVGGDIAEIDAVTGGRPGLGHLTSASLLADGDRYDPGGANLHADTELVVEVGRDVGPELDAAHAAAAVTGVCVALELVNLTRPPDDLEGIVAANVFHRAFVLGRDARPPLAAGAVARSVVNGDVRASAPARVDVGEAVVTIARLLAAAGERLRRGDRILTGAITQVAIRPGETVAAEIDGLGRVAVTLGA